MNIIITLNLFKTHNFGLPIRTTIFTENLLYKIKEIDNDNEIDVSSISNYKKYFDTNLIKVKDIYDIILEFNRFTVKKIEMIFFYNKIKDMSTELNTDVSQHND